MLLDSGASCSVVSKKHVGVPDMSPGQSIQLINAHSRSFTPLGTSLKTVTLGKLSTDHNFIVVNQLSIPVILGCDFTASSKILKVEQCTSLSTQHTSFT